MAELLYNIEKVFKDYLQENQIYNIPEYQSGYKWTEQQINQLLNDINDFEIGDNDELFYCLQNITLVEKENHLNVVDGQQRLTTIALLLAILNKSDIVKGKIHYSVREPSNNFLQEIIANENGIISRIITSENFDLFLTSNQDFDYQDIYFMFCAVRTMNNWFLNVNTKTNESINKEKFTTKLIANVKLIVNRISGIEEQELFMNLNAGRVHLDGSDLVRAILITRVAKQEMEEFDSSEVRDVVRLNERRIRIGWELDELTYWWSKQDVRTYFSYLTSIKTGEKETIKFEENKHPINLLYKIWAETKGEKEIKLGLFEEKSTSAFELYTSIIRLHRTLKDWFEDRSIYHFLGFLFAHKSDNKIRFNEIWSKWNEIENTRESFIDFLKEKIKLSVFGEDQTDEGMTGIGFWLDKIKDYNSDKPTLWKSLPELQKILLVLDVIEHALEKEFGIPLPYLKPIYFRNQKEDEEHIYPSTPQDITENRFKELTNPIESLKSYLNKLNIGYSEDKFIVWNIDTTEWENLNDEDKSKKLIELKDEIHNKRPINSIGNLVLLHLSINRSFGNDYYSDKRAIVIKNTETGKYVRQHTLKVFVKQTDTNDLNEWTMEDITRNADKIHTTLADFFNYINEEDNHE
jgi:uncharacterized protein with ParB-like and HNH nuclease domain